MKKWNISRVPLQGRPLLLLWITWASAKCQLSGLLREAGAGLEKPPLWPFREPRELTRNWRGGTRGNRAMPAPWWAFQLLLWYHLSAHYFFHCEVVYSNFSGSLLCNTGVCVCVWMGIIVCILVQLGDLNTETCCPNVIKRKYLSIFEMPTESAPVYMYITNSSAIGWCQKSHDKPSGPVGSQIQINSIVFLCFDPH